jgi:hypothetical protein
LAFYNRVNETTNLRIIYQITDRQTERHEIIWPNVILEKFWEELLQYESDCIEIETLGDTRRHTDSNLIP